jgi:hypothetical protein
MDRTIEGSAPVIPVRATAIRMRMIRFNCDRLKRYTQRWPYR